jgi:hypothetical protein
MTTTCNHDGGWGIGAGHSCRCVRKAGHSLTDSPRPHGCSCGALWADDAPLTPEEEEAAPPDLTFGVRTNGRVYQ